MIIISGAVKNQFGFHCGWLVKLIFFVNAFGVDGSFPVKRHISDLCSNFAC